MTNIIKISIFIAAIAIAFGAFFFVPAISNTVDDTVFAPIAVLAFGESGDGGCCGGDEGNDPGDYGGDDGNDPDPIPDPVPKCNYLRVNGGSSAVVPYGGGNVTLSWSTSDATSITMSSGYSGSSPSGSVSVHVTSNTNFALRPYNGNTYGDACTASVTVAPPPVASCDSFTGSPKTLPYGGGNVTLTWNTTNAKAVYLTSHGKVADDGSVVTNVTATKTFTLDVIGVTANKTCAVTITVQPQTSVASCDSLTASPTSVPYGGGNVTLTWNTTNANSVSINNGVGSVAADGSTSVFVSGNTTYTLTAVGTNGNDTCAVTITIQGQSVATCDSFTVSPNSFSNGSGGTVTLTWNTTNANSVSINQGIGSVSADGSTTYNVTGDTTFVLTAVGTNGNDTCSAPVTVTTTNTLSCDSFTANDYNVRENARVTLTWNTTGVSTVSIDNGVGTNLPADGSTSVIVDRDTTYTLTLSDGNDTRTCAVSIDTESGSGGGGSSSPKCDLDISDERVNAGDKITLTWDTSRATDIVIKDDHGNTIFDIDDYSSSNQKKYYDGEIDVRVYEDTKFTLTARKGSKKRTCKVEVEVEEEEVVVITKRQQPLVAGIALTQVPYTGFEAGPALTFIFYTILALWALFVAYILVIRKDSIFGFTLAGDTSALAQVQADEDYKKKLEMLAAKYTHQNWG